MSTKIEIRRVMFDYEKMCDMIVGELDFAVSDDNVPEDEWEEHIKYLIERGVNEYIEKTIEIHHLNDVIIYVSNSTDTFKISCDSSQIYEKPNYDVQEQTFGENLPDGEDVCIDNKGYHVREISIETILRKIRLGIKKNIENEYHNPKKLEKIMDIFYKVCRDENFHPMLKKILNNFKQL